VTPAIELLTGGLLVLAGFVAGRHYCVHPQVTIEMHAIDRPAMRSVGTVTRLYDQDAPEGA
jgi:hypothetical protein